MATEEVKLLFGADDKVTSVTKKIIKSFGPMIAGIGGVTAAWRLATSSIQKFGEQEKALKLLDQAVKSTGGAAGWTSGELEAMAGALQKVTAFGDETIERSQALLLTFKQIAGETFPQAQEAILNVATAMDMDLQSATLQIGKALNDPVANMGALSRAGIQFTKDQKDVIKAMWESGDAAGAQAIIIKELNSQFGGQARAAAQTYSGQMQQLANIAGDAQEELGGLLAKGITPIIPKLREAAENARDFFHRLSSSTVERAIEAMERAGAAAEDIARLQGIRDLQEGLKSLDSNADAVSQALRDIGDLVGGPGGLAGGVARLQADNAFREMGVDLSGLRLEFNSLRKDMEDDPFAAGNLERANELLGKVHSTIGDVGAAMADNEDLRGRLGDNALFQTQDELDILTKIISALERQQQIREMIAASREMSQLGPMADDTEMPSVGVNVEDMFSEEELAMMEWHDTKAELIEDSEANITAIHEDYAQRRIDIAQAEKEAKIDATRQLFGGLAALARQGGKASFGFYQAMAISEAIVGTHLAVTKALASSSPPISFALAAASLAKGMASVAMITQQRPPQAHGGADYIPETATYLLKQGEAVLSPDQNRELRDFLKNEKGGGVSIGSVSLVIPDGQSVKDMSETDWDDVVRNGLGGAFERAVNDGLVDLPMGQMVSV